MNDEYTEGEYFEHNDKIVLLIGERLIGINTDTSPRQIGLSVRQLVEEARAQKFEDGGSQK